MENRLGRFCDQVVEAGWLVSAVAIPLFFNIFSSRVFEPDKLTLLRCIVLLMAAARLVKLLTAGRRPAFSLPRLARSSPLALPVLAFAAVFVLTTLLSVEPRISFWGSYVRLQGLATNLAYLTLFFLVAEGLRSRLQLARLVSVIIMGSIPITLYGIIQHLQLDPLPWGGDVTFRVTSTMGNAIFLAAYLIMVVPLTLVRLFDASRNLLRAAPGQASLTARLLVAGYSLAAVIQLVAILFTKSRGPWLGLGAGLFFMVIIWFVRHRQHRAASYAGAAFAACLVVLVALNVPGSPLTPLKSVSTYVERLGTLMDMHAGTNRVRTLIWFGDGVGRGAAGLITEDPARTALGHGPESMYIVYGPYYPPDLAHLEARNAAPDRSHNDLLDYLVTMGFLGLFVYLLVFVRGFSTGLQALWKESDLSRQALVVGMLGALTAHLVESLTGIAIASTLTYTWLMLGCLSAIAVMPAEELASPVVTAAIAGQPGPGQKKRRGVRKEGSPALPAMVEPPWFRRRGLHVLVSYLVLTAAGVIFILKSTTSRDPNPTGLWQLLRDPDPASFVIISYLWLVIGILAAAVWVGRADRVRAKLDKRIWLVALVIGVIAVGLPAKLFLGSVIGDMYFKRGLNASTAQRSDVAVAPYLTAIDWSPDEDFYFLYLGQAYLEMARGNPQEKPPQRLDSLTDLGRFKDRNVAQLGRENLFRASLVALKRARELNPLNTDHSANLGRLYRLWGELSTDSNARQEKLAQSIDYYKAATALSPNAAHLKAESGLVYYLKGEFEEAAKQYQAAIRLDQQYAPTYAYQADMLRTAGDTDGAIAQYQAALSVNESSGTLGSPMDTAVRASLGEQYFRKGLFKEALQQAQKVVQSSPKDYTAHKNLALIYRSLGQPEQAAEEARVALSLAPAEEKPGLQSFLTELQAPAR